MQVGEEKKKYRPKDVTMRVTDFIPKFIAECKLFKEHCSRVRQQFAAMRFLKQILPEDHLVIQMDFSENYTCRSFEEVQSGYWGAEGVTLHPCVVYYTEGKELRHKCYVIVSDELSHGAATIFAILKSLHSILRTLVPTYNFVHYYTDSPTSQYRNKSIFQIVAKHSSLFASSAAWNYFEAGHGKGPCDGVGGTIKRLADDAIKRESAVIQDPSDFYAWTQSLVTSEMDFIFVSKTDCTNASEVLDKLCKTVRPVRGTMKLHAVYGQGEGIIQAAPTSCYCERCFDPSTGTMHCHCDLWETRRIESVKHVSQESANTTSQPISTDPSQPLATLPATDSAGSSYPLPSTTPNSAAISDVETVSSGSCKLYPIPAPVHPTAFLGKWVVVLYDGKPYPGLVQAVDEDDLEVKAMSRIGRNRFFWPMFEDVVWYANTDIIAIIDEPSPVTQSRSRHFQVEPSQWAHIMKALGLN